jgi:hypothetical protein
VPAKVSDDVAYCYGRARHCTEKAAEAGTNVVARRDFLDLEAKWLTLALSYEFSERLSCTVRGPDRRDASRAIVRRVVEYDGLASDWYATEAIAEAYDEIRRQTGSLEFEEALIVVRQLIERARHGDGKPVKLRNGVLEHR